MILRFKKVQPANQRHHGSLFFAIVFYLTQAIHLSNASAVPLTALKTEHKCFSSNAQNLVHLKCQFNERIRILDSFYGVRSQTCGNQDDAKKDCRSSAGSFESLCNGKNQCEIEFLKVYLPKCQEDSSYLTIRYECLPETSIQDICHGTEMTSVWGTLSSKDFSQSLMLQQQEQQTSKDCWCKLSATNNQRIVLSVISFDFGVDTNCSQSGLYLQSSKNRSLECTQLQKGHYYISSTQDLYVNFYRKENVDLANFLSNLGSFWIVYEASDAESNIHLKCEESRTLSSMSAKNGFLQTLPILTTPNYKDLSTRPVKTAPRITTTRTSRRTTQATTVVTEPAEVKKTTKLPVNFKNTKDSLVYKTIQKMYPKITIEPSVTIEPTATSTTTAAPVPIYTPSSVSHKLTTTLLRETKTLTQKMVPMRTTRKTIPTTTKLLLRTKATKLLTRITTKPSEKSTTRPKTTTMTTRTTTHAKMTRRRKKTKPTTTTKTVYKFSINEINKNLAKHLGYLNLTDDKLTNYSKYVSSTMTSTRDSPVKSQKIDLFESDQISNRSTKHKKLSKTELTIIVSCVTFVTLLTLINLLIYAFRKVLKNSNKKINDANSNDPNKKSYDILPGVGEIVLWAAKDKRGYLIDTNGSWAKIDGQRWLRENMAVLHNTYKKASLAYRNRFKKKDDKLKTEKEDSSADGLRHGAIALNRHEFKVMYALPPLSEVSEYSSGTINSYGILTKKSIHDLSHLYQSHHGSIVNSLNDKIRKCYKASAIQEQSDACKKETNESSHSRNSSEGSESNFNAENTMNEAANKYTSTKVDSVESANFLLQLFSIKRSSLVPKNFTSQIQQHSKQYMQPKPRQQVSNMKATNDQETYSQVYMESEKCSSAASESMSNNVYNIRPDTASEDVTRHFDHTLMEINSIINKEEQMKNQLLDKRLKPTESNRRPEFVHSKVKTLTDELEKQRSQTAVVGLQKVSKIEETIRKNNEKKEQMLTENWRKRQSIAEESLKIPPPPTQPPPAVPTQPPPAVPAQPPPAVPAQLEKNRSLDEFSIFINAIEKLQLSNFFQEENLSKLNDQQVYEALVEHARKQKICLPNILAKSKNPTASPTDLATSATTAVSCSNQQASVCKNKLESIDTYLEEEDDLPIIIRNLHSVKSLKHFFEIRTKSMVNKSPEVASSSGNNNQSSKTSENKKLNDHHQVPATGLSVKSENQPKLNPVTTHPGTTTVHQPAVTNAESDKRIQARQIEKPVAPPLPEFLKKLTALQSHQSIQPQRTLNLTEQDLAQSKSELKPHQENRINQPEAIANSSSILMMHQKYYTKHLGKPDLHHRLIREIHDKSLERSKKDSNIRFDERGNLIGSSGHFHRDNDNNSKRVVGSEQNKMRAFMSNFNAHLEEEENDSLNELISISQIPSVIQTLDRRENCEELTGSNSSLVSGFSTRSMLSEARAKLEAFSSKSPHHHQQQALNNIKNKLATASYNEGTSYLNNLNFELTRNKICKSFMITRQSDCEFNGNSSVATSHQKKSRSDNLLNLNSSLNYTSSKF